LEPAGPFYLCLAKAVQAGLRQAGPAVPTAGFCPLAALTGDGYNDAVLLKKRPVSRSLHYD